MKEGVSQMVCEKWCVTQSCVKNGVGQRWCVKEGMSKMVCERLCVTKSCVKDGV